jgi:hypothetical protein
MASSISDVGCRLALGATHERPHWSAFIWSRRPSALHSPGTFVKDADYEGVRVRFVGFLGKARVAMQIDVGFGDVITPAAETITYPGLLDFPAAVLSGYPRETVIAEKFHAMVYLRTANSRMKDFYDVWLLASAFHFEGHQLAMALGATFANRKTSIDVTPVAFTGDFTEQQSTLAQWKAFRRRISDPRCPEGLSDVVTALATFLLPVAAAIATDATFELRWPPEGPWA